MKRISYAFSSFRDALVSPCFPSRNTTASQAMRHLDPTLRAALAETVQDDVHGVTNELRDIEEQLENAINALKQANEKEKLIGSRYHQYRKVIDEQARSLRDERDDMLLRFSKRKAAEDMSSVDKEESIDTAEKNDVTGNIEDIKCVEEKEQDSLISPDVETGDTSLDDNKEEGLLRGNVEAEEAGWKDDWDKRMEKWEKDEDTLQTVYKTHLTILTNCEEMRRTIYSLQMKKEKLIKASSQCEEFLQKAGSDPATTGEVLDDDIELQVRQQEEDQVISEMELLRQDNHDVSTATNVVATTHE